MRVTLIQFILSVSVISLSFAENAHSQKLLTKRLDFKAQEQSLKSTIRELEKISDSRFIYSNSLINTDNKVSLELSNTLFTDVLHKIFDPLDITYTISGNQVVLQKKKAIIKSLKGKLGDHIWVEREDIKLTGTVKDDKGEPLAGVSVVLKGTAKGMVTDISGRFEISVPDQESVLQFRLVGYSNYELRVGSSTNLDIVMTLDTKSLEELVVVGYGTVKKRDLTGSVAQIKGTDIVAFPVSDPVQALQGRTPGVQITTNTGAPDGDFQVRIRGVNSIRGGNGPLFIVDGIPFSNYTVNQYDIESIEILKDASATAIYGSRGANGVILITTKRGKEGKANINYSIDYGIQKAIKKLDLMDAQQWGRFYNEYLVSAKILTEAPFSEADIAAMGKGVDWQNEVFQPAPIQNHNLSVSGGTDKIKYHIAGSAFKRDGLVHNSMMGKYNLRSTLDVKAHRLLDISMQMGYTFVDRMNQNDGGGNGGSSMLAAAYSAPPTFSPYNENGKYRDLRSLYSWSSHELRNPLMMAYESRYKTAQNLNNINASANFKPFKGLSLRSSVGLENSDSRFDGYTNSRYIYQNNSASVSNNRYTNFTNENILSYQADLNKDNSLNVMTGYTIQSSTSRSIAASGNTFLSDVPETNALQTAGIINTPTTGFSKWVLLSYLGRINYSFKDKYLLTTSIRADGSSRYSPGQRWGYFPSAAVAWRISAEPFMENVRQVTDLKIRASYGETGSTAISPYGTQNLLSAGKAATGAGNYTYFAPGSTYPGSLKWETTTQIDAGIDLAMFDNRLRFTADYYYKYTTDLLNAVYLPSSSGYTSSVRNIGRMDNKGVELMIEGDVIRNRDWKLNASFNISHNKNTVVKLEGGEDILGSVYNNYGSGTLTVIREGQPLGAFYLFKDAGINSTGQLSYANLDESVDANGNATYTDADRYIAGNPFPDFFYGATVDLRYKKWALNMLWQGTQGNDVFNLSEMRNLSYSQGMNISSKVYEQSWREGQDNSNARYPKIQQTGGLRFSDRFLEDGSYLRLKNISLAYHIPVPQTLNWIKSANIYVAAQNYLTFTKYTGVDPEVSSKGGDIDGAIDHLSYPNSKTLTVGTRIQF